MSDRESKKRLIWVDALKGFTILLVVLGHDLRGLQSEKMIVTGVAFWKAANSWIYSFHMMLFFILSGYLFYRVYEAAIDDRQTHRRLWLHVADMAVLYYAYSILLWASRFILSKAVHTHVSWKQLLLIPISPLELYWFIWTLLVYYLITALLFRLLGRVDRKVELISLLGLLCLSMLSGLLSKIDVIEKTAFYAVGFAFGSYSGRHGFSRIRKAPVSVVAAIFTLIVTVGVFLLRWTPHTVPVLNTVTAMLFSFAFIDLTFLLVHTAKPLLNGFAFLGQYSLVIYLLHLYFVGIDRRIVKKLGLPVSALTILLCTAVETALPILVALLLKRLGVYELFVRPVTWALNRKQQKRGKSSPGRHSKIEEKTEKKLDRQ